MLPESTSVRPEVLLFDLDGTLTDSRPGIINCIHHALDVLGFNRGNQDYSWCLGPPLHKSFTKILATDDPAKINHAVALYRERFVTKGMFENNLYPDIELVLTKLIERGHRLFVATSKPRIYAEKIIAHFGLTSRFDGIYGSELDGQLSDKSELIKHVLEQESIAADRAWMIGDREHDIIGARKNSLRAIGVLWGYGGEHELVAAGADHLVSQTVNLLDLPLPLTQQIGRL